MTSTPRLRLLLLSLPILIGGCSTVSPSPESAPPAQAAETGAGTVEKPAAAPAPACKSIADTGNKTAPPAIYENMKQCAQADNFDQGVALFALAGAYSFYDALRMADPSTFPVRTELLRDSFNGLGASRKAAFKNAVKNALGNDGKRASICREVKQAGPPDYYPAYMVSRGENGSALVKTGGGLTSPFDSGMAWEEALDRFLHCPQPQ